MLIPAKIHHMVTTPPIIKRMGRGERGVLWSVANDYSCYETQQGYDICILIGQFETTKYLALVGTEVSDTEMGRGTGVDFGGENRDLGVLSQQSVDAMRSRKEGYHMNLVLLDSMFLQNVECFFSCGTCF